MCTCIYMYTIFREMTTNLTYTLELLNINQVVCLVRYVYEKKMLTVIRFSFIFLHYTPSIYSSFSF